ncbi:hypothetical protein [Actinomadura roseirufa]|uniref:hypothetical protein n=1 Tax=Actinomadura roseirufa TaxID=2094049 RepID=UPI0010413102|nr:hypothetical protein [Actinomadura roseirufa]
MGRVSEAGESGTSECPDGTDHPDAYARLGALMSRLHIYGLTTVLQRCGLTVINPKAVGCCPDVPHPADTITCKAREDDGGRSWFFTSWGEPIAEADRIVDAALIVATTLGAPMKHGCAGE